MNIEVFDFNFRFDLKGTGAVKTTHFMKILGLDEFGRPRCHSSLGYTSRMRNERTYTKTPYPRQMVFNVIQDNVWYYSSFSKIIIFRNLGGFSKFNLLYITSILSIITAMNTPMGSYQ